MNEVETSLPDIDVQKATKTTNVLCEVVEEAASVIAEAITEAFNNAVDVFVELQNTFSISFKTAWRLAVKDPHYSRIRHLMIYGKARTRKKNRSRMNRLIDKYYRIALQRNKFTHTA